MTRLDENAISPRSGGGGGILMFLFNVVTGGNFVRLDGTYVGRKESRKYIKKKAGWLWKKVQKYVAHKFVLSFAAVKFFLLFPA